jgi:septal ring-binding cell division protein DamX
MKSVITVALLAVVVVGGWIAYTSQNQPAPRPVVVPPGPTPLPSPTEAAAVGQAQPVPSAAAAKPGITPIPATTPGPKTADKPTPSPKATPMPKALPTPTPSAVAASRPTSTAKPVGGGYEALKAGRLAEASAAFESVAQTRSSEFSVQLLVACSAQTIEKAIQNDPSAELFVLPATIGGKPCHRLMRGFYKTSDEAAQAVLALPGYYVAEGAKPKAVPMKSVVR